MKLIKKLGLFVITGAMATAIGISIHQANNIRSVKAVGSTTVVISEVYGAGGNSGAVYKNDYVELYNLSSAEVSLAGWAVQQASATGTSWSVTNLSGVIAAEGYYLVHMAGGSEGAALPAADATGSSNFSGTNFKVALTNSTTKLTGTQETKSASVVDFLGAGTANAYETAASPAASTTKSVQRKVVSGVMQETDNNSQDFEAADPTPTNSQVSVAVTGVSLNKTTTTLIETQTETLVATIAPENATNQAISWSVDEAGADNVSVDSSGEVTALSVGVAIVTVTTADGGKTASCEVTVSEKVLNSIVVKTPATYTTFALGKQFNHNGLVITATYNSGVEDLTTGFSVTGVDTTKLGKQTATITLGTKSLTYSVTVTNQGASVGTKGSASDLYISEYIEGAIGNNKALEVYNGTGSTVDLSSYKLALYSNGSIGYGSSFITLSTIVPTLAHGQVVSVVNSGATSDFKVGTYATSTVTYFNGDDAVALLKNDVVLDVIGVIGTDPGTAWTTTEEIKDADGGESSTADKTLVRAPSITSPSSTFSFTEWKTYDADTSTYIGSHTTNFADLSYLEQATAYANFVLTGNATSVYGGCVEFKTILDAEYGYMDAAAQEIFDESRDALFVEAQNGVMYINAWVASQSPSGMIDNYENNSKSLYAIIVICVVGITIVGATFYLKKRQVE